MGFIPAYLIALVVAVFATAGGSLLWPKITSQPRPPILEKVHDITLLTPFGQEVAQVLGVANEAEVTPLDISSLAASAATSLTAAAKKKTQQLVVKKAVEQLTAQINELPPEEQEQIRSLICAP